MNLYRVLILARESEDINKLVNGLIMKNYVCSIISDEERLASGKPADLLLVETGDGLAGTRLKDTIRRIKRDRDIPIVLLAAKETLRDVENESTVEDFVLKPYDPNELSVRINRLLRKTKPKEESLEYLKAGNVFIDLLRCEVSVAGKVVDLTFTEYELLKLLMSKKGHVLTREMLLNKIWGYDYFGGDRTVDVHITRLRSKIEDPTHSFIETVRNMGYRIKANDK